MCVISFLKIEELLKLLKLVYKHKYQVLAINSVTWTELLDCSFITVKPLYTDIGYNEKTRYNDNLNEMIPNSR